MNFDSDLMQSRLLPLQIQANSYRHQQSTANRFRARLYKFFGKSERQKKKEYLFDNSMFTFAEERRLTQKKTHEWLKIWLPFDLKTLLWQLIVTLMVSYYMIMVPIEIAFGLAIYSDIRQQQVIFGVDIMALIIFGIDMLVQFNLAYYSKGILVGNRSVIEQIYFKRKFILDVFVQGSIALELINQNYWTSIPKIIIFSKITRVFDFDRKVQLQLLNRPKTYAIYQFIKVTLSFLIYSHVMACGYFMLDFYFYANPQLYPYRKNDMVWLVNSSCLPDINMITTYKWFVWYLYSAYWAIQTATTVGYGDITPRNPPEVLYVTINMIIMCIMFGYFLNSLWKVLFQINHLQVQRNQFVQKLKFYMLDKHIDKALQEKVTNYINYLYQLRHQLTYFEDIQAKLSITLRQQLLLGIYDGPLSSPLFQNFLNRPESFSKFKKELCLHITQNLLPEGQIINYKTTFSQILYIETGEVQYKVGREHCFSQINGFISLQHTVVEQPSKFIIQTSAITVIYQLSLSSLWQVLRGFKNFWQEIKILKQKARLGDNQQLSELCHICGIIHQTHQCPHVHFIPQYPARKASGRCPRKPLKRGFLRTDRVKLQKGISRPAIQFERAQLKSNILL